MSQDYFQNPWSDSGWSDNFYDSRQNSDPDDQAIAQAFQKYDKLKTYNKLSLYGDYVLYRQYHQAEYYALFGSMRLSDNYSYAG